MNRSQSLSVKNVLVKARASVLEGWTQEVNAKDADGVEVDSEAEEAVCWCAIGAIRKHGESEQTIESAIIHMGLFTYPGYLASWNDVPRRTRAQVLKAFDKAIIAILPVQATRRAKAGAK